MDKNHFNKLSAPKLYETDIVGISITLSCYCYDHVGNGPGCEHVRFLISF